MRLKSVMSVIECNNGKLKRRVTQEETVFNSKKLTSFLQEYVPEKSRILLFMSHNVHLPAIVSSFKTLRHTYVPININADDEEFEELVTGTKIHFILSFNENLRIFKNFQLMDDIKLCDEQFLLWKNEVTHPVLDTFESLCIIPTSGTTGKKKLINIGTHCIQTNIQCLRSKFNLTKDDVIFFGTPLTFDPSLVELLLAIETGATLLIVPEEVRLSPKNLFQTLFPIVAEHPPVTFLQMVPSLFTRWSEKQIKYILNESQLRILAFGGEDFPMEILNYDRKLRLFNLYGLTEISCWATIYEIKQDNKVFIGDVLDETFVKILENGVEIQEGIGELFIGSDTRVCCVDGELENMRSTGDIVKKNNEGILYIGRKNNCIKRLGNRIFLEDIERRIQEKTNLHSKCVFLQDSSKLLLFILIESIHQEDKTRIMDKLRVKLRHVLKKHEFPDFLDIISIFPLTNNGKIDTETLTEIYKRNKEALNMESLSDLFLILLTEYLGLSLSNFETYKKYNFFQLGGNSILYNLMINSLKDSAKDDLPQELTSLLFDESIENCMNFLEQFNEILPRKKIKVEVTEERRKCRENCEIFWQFNMHGCVDAPPLVFQRRGEIFVAVGSFSNFFIMFNGNTGEVIFEKQLQDSIGSKAAVSECLNFVYIGCFDGHLFCINLDTNSVQWKYKAGDSIKSTPNFCMENKALVFGSYDKHLHCINAKTGKCIWKTNIRESIVTTPLIDEATNRIIITTLIGSCISISEESGVENWRFRCKNPIFSSPFTIGENILFVDVRGNIFIINEKTGKQISHIGIKDEVYSAVTLIENFLIVGSQKGFLYKCEICDFSSVIITKRLHLNESIAATPFMFHYDNEIIIIVFTIHGFLYLIDFSTMDIISYWKCSGDVFSSPFILENKLYFGCRDDNLYCLSMHSLLN